MRLISLLLERQIALRDSLMIKIKTQLTLNLTELKNLRNLEFWEKFNKFNKFENVQKIQKI